MDIKAILFVTVFLFIFVIVTLILNWLASGDKEKLINWSLTIYKYLIPLSLLMNIYLNYRTNNLATVKEYLFLYINIICCLLVILIRWVYRVSMKRRSTIYMDQRFYMIITMSIVAVPLLNILYFISAFQEL
ncbi:MAG: hypothetical protein K0R57_574 [Paenibacillaceae bacterium]|jgi:hypothetical protein|nr:hypothetical protein [Paenibacillaceae bacterium]